jgi:hypothetical protein
MQKNAKKSVKNFSPAAACRDGHISFSEFMVVMYVLSNGTPEDNLKQIFRM